MRRTALGLVILVGCGGGNKAADAPPGPIDGPPGQIDANPDLPDAAQATCTPVNGTTVSAQLLPGQNDLLDLPILVTAPVGDRRLFVVQRSGEIQIYVDDALIAAPFLDIRDNNGGPVLAGGEQGLLGLAFHPDYATNGKFYVYYTTQNGGLFDEIAEYQVSATDPNVADPTTARVVLSIPDYAGNHNGGMIEFGTDGYLYISTGDGGNQDDPNENGQNTNALLAKMLRIDVDNPGGGREYGIPATNPFAAGGGAPEVLMYGLRNPWRWSFDHANGDIYIGDVGGAQVEEIDVIPAGTAAGKNLGWDTCEGYLQHLDPGDPAVDCTTPAGNEVGPVVSRVRPAGGGSSNFNAIIGGQVYRGSCYPDLVGRYFYSDNGAGGLHSFVYSGGAATDAIDHAGTFPSQPTSIHADSFGELYIGSPSGVYHLVAQ